MSEHEHRSFATLIGSLEDGVLQDELTRKVRDLVAELHDTLLDQGGKPAGSLTLKLDFKLDSGVIEVAGDVKLALPKRTRSKTIFYATQDNNLTRRNPRQQELPLRDVSSGRAETRAV